jgi:hypothetical protein
MKKNNIVIGAVLVLIVVAIIALVWVSISSSVDENVILWRGPGGDYRIEVNEFPDLTTYLVYLQYGKSAKAYPLRTSPTDAEEIPFDVDFEESLSYYGYNFVTRDYDLHNLTEGKSSIAVLEFGTILGKSEYGLYGLKLKSATTEENNRTIEEGLPLVTCDMDDALNSVIYLKLGSENRVYTSSTGCIIIEGVDGDGLIASADRFAYALLRVM